LCGPWTIEIGTENGIYTSILIVMDFATKIELEKNIIREF